MVWSVLGTLSGGGSASTTTIAPALPTGWAADDIHLMFLESRAAEPITPPAGWAHAPGSPQVGADTQLTILYRRAVGGDTAPTVADPGDHILGGIIGIRGATTSGSPFRNSAGGSASSSAAVIFQNVAANGGDLVVCMSSAGRDINSTNVVAGSPTYTNMEDGGSVGPYDFATWTNQGDGGTLQGIIGLAPAALNVGGGLTLGAAGAQALLSLSMIPDATFDRINASRVGLGAVVDTSGGVLALSRVGLGAVVDVDGNSYGSYMAASRVGVGFVIYPDPNYFKRRYRANVN